LGPTDDGGAWITTIPRVGYRFVGLPAKAPTEGIAETSLPLIQRDHRPSIAVLPFANLSGEREQEYLADGITEDIITALTRFRSSSPAIRASPIRADRLTRNKSRR